MDLKNLPVKYRILIIFSICWIVGFLAGLEPWRTYRGHNNWDEYFASFIPLILIWGIVWIVKGVREQKKS